MNVQIKIDWWKAEDRSAAIDAGHLAALRESGVERAAKMIAEGYTSGELSDWVRMYDTDPEDGIEYRGWWSLNDIEEKASLPEGWEIVPEDLVSHRNDWRGACEIALANIAADDAMVFQDLRDHWQNRIYLLNNVDWKIAQSEIDKEALSLPQGWDIAPVELKAQLQTWKQACELALTHSPGRDPETRADDKSYWKKQLRVLRRIEDLLNAEHGKAESPWIPVTSALPSIPEHHIRGEKPFIVKRADGSVHVAHLLAGRPDFASGTWWVDEEGIKQRHWVALEGGESNTDRILSDVVEWMFLPGTEGEMANFVMHAEGSN
jgi:hypothetical protein